MNTYRMIYQLCYNDFLIYLFEIKLNVWDKSFFIDTSIRWFKYFIFFNRPKGVVLGIKFEYLIRTNIFLSIQYEVFFFSLFLWLQNVTLYESIGLGIRGGFKFCSIILCVKCSMTAREIALYRIRITQILKT